MSKFLLRYHYGADLAAQRSEEQSNHRAWLQSLDEQGRLVAAGAFPDGSGAAVVLEFDSLDDAVVAADLDPYFSSRLIADREIKEWRIRWGVLA